MSLTFYKTTPTITPCLGRKHQLFLLRVDTRCCWLQFSSQEKKKKQEEKTLMWKRRVIQETRKTKHNLLTLHLVPESIWTARPTLGLLLSSLMWPCASCVPGCTGAQLQHHPHYPDGWLLIMPFC